MGNNMEENHGSVRAVIYDLDGTIYNKFGIQFLFFLIFINNIKLLRAYLRARKLCVGRDFGNSPDMYLFVVSEMESYSGRSNLQCREFISRFMAVFIKLLSKLYSPGADVVNSITGFSRKGLPIACLSDFPMVNERLAALGIDSSIFNYTGSTEDYGALKPAARPFLETAALLGSAPAHTLVIGDRNDTDRAGAAAAGMQFIKIPEEKHKLTKLADG
jgi:phosphoglycolate phosphatase